ncbi:hypothetical protein KD050_05780 [Psychrobacillus sp. INOP01]|uniref:hypothetical protein n=1 Tax=Psychrobacillus sp. INOP01 TaxID=2829187 RepID=UPI001BAC87D4|nr:hypothetical protein [Psychrobacillus sp. INOP01]QUG42777.1 hypothetical protein KD050_05780 [Psychrobacillus sp. INOP01]
MDDRFEVSFRNPLVRMWFYVMLPTIIASIILFIILPSEYHLVVRMAGTLILAIFTIWAFINNRKSKEKKGG